MEKPQARILVCAMAIVMILCAGAASALAADLPIVPLAPEHPARGMRVADALAFLELSADGFITASPEETAPQAADAAVSTGMIIHYSSGAQAYCAIRADVLGTGRLTLSQVVRLASAVVGFKPLEGPYRAAGDLNEDGQITLSDLVLATRLYVQSALGELFPPSPSTPESDIQSARDAIVSYVQALSQEPQPNR